MLPGLGLHCSLVSGAKQDDMQSQVLDAGEAFRLGRCSSLLCPSASPFGRDEAHEFNDFAFGSCEGVTFF